MILWRLDRLGGAGVLCALGSVAIVLITSTALAVRSSTDGLFGALMITVALVAIANATGSAIPLVLGFLVYGAVVLSQDVSPVVLLIIGGAMFISAMLFNIGTGLRRRPQVANQVWTQLAVTIAIVCAAAAGLFAIAWFAATRSTWDALVVPIALITMGFCVRLAVDAHVRRTRGLGGSL